MVFSGCTMMNEAYVIPVDAIIEDIKRVTHKNDVRLANLHEAMQWSLRYRPEHFDQLSTEPRPDSVGKLVEDLAMGHGLHDKEHQSDKSVLVEHMATGAQSVPTTAGRVDSNRASSLEHPSVSAHSAPTRMMVEIPELEQHVPGVVSDRHSSDDSMDEKAQNAQLYSSTAHTKGHAKDCPNETSEFWESQWKAAHTTAQLDFRPERADDEQGSWAGRLLATSHDERSENEMSMLVETSDYSSKYTLPALSIATTTPSASVASSDIVISKENPILQPNDAGTLAVPQLRNRAMLECPFDLAFLCSKSFSHKDDWIKHSLEHFCCNGRVIHPPTTNLCCFCQQTFHSSKPYESWKERMIHVSLHHDAGHTLRQARPDFALFNYLFRNRLIDEETFRDLNGRRIPQPLITYPDEKPHEEQREKKTASKAKQGSQKHKFTTTRSAA